jgi:hypothetical protein
MTESITAMPAQDRYYKCFDKLLKKQIPDEQMDPGSVSGLSDIVWNDIKHLKVDNLKRILKVFDLKTSGVKQALVSRLKENIVRQCSAISIQRIIRGWLIGRSYKIFSAYERLRSECVNDTDFYNLDPLEDIPKFKFVAFVDDKHVYGFSAHSLEMLAKTHPATNPYTRNKIPPFILKHLSWMFRLPHIKQLNAPDTTNEAALPFSTVYSLRVVKLFQFINAMGNYSDPSWYLDLTVANTILFFRYLQDIWYYRAGISLATMRTICPIGDPFTTPTQNHIDLPDIPPNMFFKVKVLYILELMLYHGINQDGKSLGAMYILSALTLVSDQAAIALPYLYHSVYDANL